jgi:hypothetical protein
VAHEQRPRPGRVESREVQELRQVKAQHPELATAVDMQIELIELHRRIQARLPTPLIHRDASSTRDRLAHGERLVDFDDLPLDWSDFRLMFRQTAEVLRRYDAVDAADDRALQALVRDGNSLEPVTRDYYVRTPRPDRVLAPAEGQPGMLDQVLALALRPFLARCAEVWAPRLDHGMWTRPWCPVCGAEPDLAVLHPSGERWLICGRCTAQWPFTPLACPFCGHDGPGATTSFASRDGRYRVYGCNQCRKYLKAYDLRGATRPVLPTVDTIATLPLDAAAIQKGYDG